MAHRCVHQPDLLTIPELPDLLLERARDLAAGGGRRILGVTGLPGRDVTTVAQAVVDVIKPRAVQVPTAGFGLIPVPPNHRHEASREHASQLADAWSCFELLKRLKASHEPVIFAPELEQDAEDPITTVLAVPSSIPLIVTAHSHLLLDQPPWPQTRQLIEEVWFVESPDPRRLSRPASHREPGAGSSADYAELIEQAKHRADLIYTLSEDPHVAAGQG